LAIHLQSYQFAAANLYGLRVLDRACGCGYGTYLLAEQNPDKQVTGVDIDPAAIRYAELNYQLPNLNYRCADAQTFSAEQRCSHPRTALTCDNRPQPSRCQLKARCSLAKII
jgi:2-polyprenyl-3-methyl-5-hydroxy-6-metoxy-1,4-benzoquinol methylase